jgi:putative ABC transport system ATP-binding protein
MSASAARAALEAVGSPHARRICRTNCPAVNASVAIARSIVNRPNLILADEPTGNLDSVNGNQIIDLLFDLHKMRGVTLVLVTHDAALAAACGRQVGIKDGRLSQLASAQRRKVAR